MLAETVGPGSETFVVVMAVATALALAGALAVWGRVRGRRIPRMLQRLGLLLVCQATAVGAVFAGVNHANQFYVTWGELWGTAGPATVTIQGDDTTSRTPSGDGRGAGPGAPTPSTASGTSPAPSATTVPANYTVVGGGVLRTRAVGPSSGVSGEIDVWTPPGYDPHRPGGYPVILALAGYPGQPVDALDGLALPAALQADVSAGRLPASLVVAATINVDGKNWGCADTPGGPRVGTWLTRDVPALVSRDFGVDAGVRWAVLGLSEGGWCAVRLALTDPAQFAAAVSLSGGDAADAPPLVRTIADRHANDLRTLAAHGASPAVDLLLAGSRQDSGTVPDAQALQQAAGAGVHVDLEVVDGGGHNWRVWRQMTPPALAWLGAHWPAPGAS